jgi:hypothetical protein
MLIRLILIVLGLVVAVRLIKIVAKSVRAFKEGNLPDRKPKGEVGEGWIVDEKKDKEED